MKIDINLEENKILISSKENYNDLLVNIYQWNPYDNTESPIYSRDHFDLHKEYVYCFSPGTFMSAYFGVIVHVYNSIISKKERFRIKTINGLNIKNQALILWSSTGLGDNLFCTPIIKKLSQSWHIINNSMGFISHTSGLFHLAMSTSTIIFELGSYCSASDWISRKYKNIYIEGECKLQCYNNDYCCVSEHGTINKFVSTYKCHLNFETYKCHPTPESVIKKIGQVVKLKIN